VKAVEASKRGIKVMQYQRPPDSTAEEAEAVIDRDDPAELYVIPISVSMYHEDLDWSQSPVSAWP
jgi:hypothetical protein